MPDPTIVEREPSAEDVAAIHRGLFADDPATLSPRDYAPLAVLLRDPDGTLLGGLLGATIWRWLTVNSLWVAAHARGVGHGAQLLVAAETAALRRGCTHARLDTFDFQARGFYEQCGYETYGQLDGFPAGYVQSHLRKTLVPALDAPAA